MINELVSSILEAEQRATEISAEAVERAQSINDEARAKANERLKAAEVSLKAEITSETEKNKAFADEIYDEIFSSGKKEAQDLKNKCAVNAEKYAEEIARGVLSGDC